MSRIWPPPGIFVFGVNRTLWFQSHTARRGNRITPGHVMKKKPEIKNSLMGHVAKIQTLPTYAYMNSSLFNRLRCTLKTQSVLGITNRCAYNIVLVIQWKQRIIYDLRNFNTIALAPERFNHYFRSSEVLRNSVYIPCFKLSFFRLPLHGPLWHGLVSLSDPEHCSPPLDGGGLVQVRERSCCPAPQVTLHSLQSP